MYSDYVFLFSSDIFHCYCVSTGHSAPRSLFVIPPDCADKMGNCAMMKQMGKCSIAHFASTMCALTCGTCGADATVAEIDVCEDNSYLCALRTASTVQKSIFCQFSSNKNLCPKSCDRCKPG